MVVTRSTCPEKNNIHPWVIIINRLTSLLQHLKRLPEVLEGYDTIIKNQLSSGIIEIASTHPSQTQVLKFTTFLIILSFNMIETPLSFV